MARILTVESDHRLQRTIGRALQMHGHEVHQTGQKSSALRMAAERQFDVAVVSSTLGGQDVLRRMRALQPACMRVLISTPATMSAGMDAVNRGEISQVIARPLSMGALLETVSATLQIREHMLEITRVQQAAARAEELQMLDECFSSDHIQLALQPMLSSRSRDVVAFEGLLRSSHAVLSGPLSVLRAAEAHDRINDIGDLVFQRAADWLTRLPSERQLFLNVHPDELSDPDLFAQRLNILADASDRVVLELTERSRLQSLYGWEDSLQLATEMGFSVAVDDLGSGYSSLSALADLQPRFIKMDISIVRGVDASRRKQRMVAMLCRFAEATGAQLVAKCVETEAEAAALTEAGTHLLQGYLFGRPSLEVAEALKW